MYILDTNVVAELRKQTSNQNVRVWASSIPAHTMYLSAISILELELGVLKIENKDRRQGKMLRHWLENQVLPSFDRRVISIDAKIARRCAQLHFPDPKSERDALIAATALVHEMTVVTRNTSDFSSADITVIDPWV